MSEEDIPRECDACGYEAGDRLGEFQIIRFRDKPFTFCDLCASTYASIRHYDPGSAVPGEAEILRAISYVGNTLLDAINGSRAAAAQSKGAT